MSHRAHSLLEPDVVDLERKRVPLGTVAEEQAGQANAIAVKKASRELSHVLHPY
jgi:hypothetical protein